MIPLTVMLFPAKNVAFPVNVNVTTGPIIPPDVNPVVAFKYDTVPAPEALTI